MGSLSDDRKKRDEERRIAGLKKEIQDLEVELKEYEAAKEKVQNAKANCNTEVTSWQETVGKFAQKEIKQPDVFEGEMANKLETYIDDAKEENDKGIEKAAELLTELGTQIDKINEKISFLNNSIDYKRSLI